MTRKIFQFVGPTKNSDGETSVKAYQHQRAAELGETNDAGRSLMKMLAGWEDYTEAYEKRYEGPIGDDGVIGRYWAETGLAIKRLLDGETGGLDCGSIASNITASIEAQGMKTDGYELLDMMH